LSAVRRSPATSIPLRPQLPLVAGCLAALLWMGGTLAPVRSQNLPEQFLIPLPGGGVVLLARPAAPPQIAPSPPPAPQLTAVPIPSPPILRFNARDPRPRTPYSDLIYKAARRHAVNPRVVAAVIAAESDFRPRAVSSAGAYGLMQLLPGTARRFGLLKKRDLFNPAKNIEAGVRYIRWLTERFGNDLARVIAAYNAGEGAVERFGGVPPFSETQDYLRRIYGTLGLSSLLTTLAPAPPEAVFPLAAGSVAASDHPASLESAH